VRLFVALVPPVELRSHLDAAIGPVRVAHPQLQWVPSERWHLTLAFYGEVADGQLARVQRRIDRATRGAAALQLQLAGAGQFGGRVLWVGVQGQRSALRALARSVATDGRDYRPHLTVARVRRDADPRPAVAMLEGYGGPGWTAGDLLLVRSHLGPKPRHEPIGTWPLPARPSADRSPGDA
jgi:RNA 2',3'-cyclic 3'-phosphodiesterase